MQSEFDHTDIATAPCHIVKAPRVADAPAALECRVVHGMEFKNLEGEPTGRYLVVGQAVGTHLKDEFITGGRFDCAAAQVVDKLLRIPPVW